MVLIIDTMVLVKAENLINSKIYGKIINLRAVYGKSKIVTLEKMSGEQKKIFWRWYFIRSGNSSFRLNH